MIRPLSLDLSKRGIYVLQLTMVQHLTTLESLGHGKDKERWVWGPACLTKSRASSKSSPSIS
jgi:hypothetical protein